MYKRSIEIHPVVELQSNQGLRNECTFDMIDNSIKLECLLLDICCQRGYITFSEAVFYLKPRMSKNKLNIHIAANFLGNIICSSTWIKEIFPMNDISTVAFCRFITSFESSTHLFSHLPFYEISNISLVLTCNLELIIRITVSLFYFYKEQCVTNLISSVFDCITASDDDDNEMRALACLHPSVRALAVCAEAKAHGCDCCVLETVIKRMAERVWNLLGGAVNEDGTQIAFPSNRMTREKIIVKNRLDYLQIVQVVVSVVITEEGFRGNNIDYENLANSWIDSVCITKRGNKMQQPYNSQ